MADFETFAQIWVGGSEKTECNWDKQFMRGGSENIFPILNCKTKLLFLFSIFSSAIFCLIGGGDKGSLKKSLTFVKKKPKMSLEISYLKML